MAGEIVGIDLGTTKSVIARWRDGAPRIIADPQGRSITPSVVALDPATGQLVAGWHAQSVGAVNPERAISSIKRFMGRRFTDDVVQTAIDKLRVFYTVDEAQRNGGIEVSVGALRLTPQQVSARILQELKDNAEAELGHAPTRAVVTVPAYFHDSQRQATRNAGRIAGLDVTRVLNEPTAACLAYGYNRLADQRRLVAVYDLGGGTFDISILEVGRGPFRVRATNGDTHLGGDDLDWMLVEWALGEISTRFNEQLAADVHALAHLRAAAKEAKADLSTQQTTRMKVPGRLSPSSDIQDLDLELTRERLDAIAASFVQSTLGPCRGALEDAGVKVSDIKEVLLVGGQTRMPAIRYAVAEFFGREPDTSLHPEQVVALGAAVQAAIISGDATGLKLADVVPLSLGVRTDEGLMYSLVPRNTQVPFRKVAPFSTTSDNQEAVEIRIYQGERPKAVENTRLGEFMLHGIKPARAGEPEIEVTFHVDADGILHVSAEDVETGNFKELTVTNSLRLSEDEIVGMVRDAEAHAAEYEEGRRRLALEGQATRLRSQLTTMLAERRASLTDELADAIRASLDVEAPADWAAHVRELTELLRRAGGAGP
jgi:molecular chaperone DnaK